MEREYGKQVEFLMIYIHEAHAVDGTAPMSRGRGPVIEEPITFEERKGIAKLCSGALDMSPLRMLVDDMDDSVATAYAAHPDRLYLVDEEGKVAYAGGKGPRGFSTTELEDALRAQLGLKPKDEKAGRRR